MGLIACPDCGKPVSDQAPVCATCGRPMRSPAASTPPPIEKRSGCRSATMGCLVVGGSVLFLIYVVGLLMSTKSHTSGDAAPSMTTLYNTASSLNVRAEPRADAPIVATLGFGESVLISSSAEETVNDHTWVKIDKGWVVKDYLSKDRPLTERERLAGPVPEQSAWNGSYSEVKDYLREAMHDPSSLEWEGCTKVFWEQSKRAYLVGCVYRGNNAFGAKVKNANWFLIRHGAVVEMKDGDAYEWK